MAEMKDEASSNEDSEEDVDVDADVDVDVEESPRGHKSVSTIIAEIQMKNEQEAASARNQKEDEQQRIELTNLSPAALAVHIRVLEAELYELCQREARELSRSKHLSIFGSSRRRSSK